MKLSLNGEWTLLDGDDHRPVPVPGCWEAAGVPKDAPGPYVYERDVLAPPEWAGRRLWLRFEGVSYHAVVSVDGREAGHHTGVWDAFEVEVTHLLTPGVPARVHVAVEKPASLERGPASEAVPGRFPLKETLAGFLPYVWGHLFGGIWQDVWLEARPDIGVANAHIRAEADGRFTAEVLLTAPTRCSLELVSPDGQVVVTQEQDGQTLTFAGTLEEARPWHPDAPALYEARLRVGGEVVRAWRFGFRSFHAEGTTLLLNARPFYPRLALSWGWYEEALHSNPGRERVRADLLRLKGFGYNGVKLCLWVPPAYYFEVADELGMALWLELPMWLPKVTPFFLEQTPVEYERILRQVRQHPSLVLCSLGCELNREVGADVLGPLYARAKMLLGDVLLRDNSGSGEAYGGLLDEHADYYDYHFYSDIQFFGPLIDYFTPRWRPVQPWVFGEFCDLDTFRDLDALAAARGGTLPWWTSSDPRANPQGARWQYDVPFQAERLAATSFAGRGEELARISNQQALLHRKYTLELVRTYREISGYVITGERDTPISTAGMWDDRGVDKFPPAPFKAFNDDLVLSLGWDKRRAWVRGGDRAAYWDTFSYPAGARVRPHVIASTYGAGDGPGTLIWQVADGESVLAEGSAEVRVARGEVREVAIAAFEMPVYSAPRAVTLSARLEVGGVKTQNTWTLWSFPADPWRAVAPVALRDPEGRLSGLADLVALAEPREGAVLVSTVWDEIVEERVRSGGRAVLLAAGGGRPELLPTVPLPFWREAVKVLEPHPAWDDFPHDGWADLQFFGMAPDLALDTAGEPAYRPILRRLDARTAAVHDYATELPLGAGSLIVSTLRFEGGLGQQPLGLGRNTAAAYLLRCWLRYLQGA